MKYRRSEIDACSGLQTTVRLPDRDCGQVDEDILSALRRVVGPANVFSDDATLDRYAASTGLGCVRARAVVRPADTAEVKAIVLVAGQHHFPLYPISRGRNWGYGDACPVTPSQVILDLGRMNRIVEVNPELAYAEIEPGVTQGQLSDYLQTHHPSLWADCTGAGPDVSVVGNILDRGFGHTAYGNRFQTVCGLEVVLADGRTLHTGTGHYAGSRTYRTYPYGVGPYIDGIFTQSNFGIVTRMGLWLMPAPEEMAVFIVTAEEQRDIAALVDALRPLRMDGTLRSVVHIGNDLRLIASAGTFPFDAVHGLSSLPGELREQLRRSAGIGNWTGVGALYGDRRQVAASARRVRRALRGFRLQFLTERRLQLARMAAVTLRATGWGRRLKSLVDTAEALYGLNRGRPTRRFLLGAYWRRREGIPPEFPENCNPALDGCSFLWLSPTLPALGREVIAFNDLVTRIVARHGFDFFVTFSMINERSLGAVITLCFDRDNAAEAARAGNCYREMFSSVVDAGYVPYRVGTTSMASLVRRSEGFWDVTAALKQALDPDNIIAPGRYEPGAALQAPGEQ